MKTSYDLIVIGGGPAGLGAAVAAYDRGVRDILIIERDRFLGGILNQCIHTGFGLREFREELTGPEYAARFIDQVDQRGITALLETMVLALHRDHTIDVVSPAMGRRTLQARAIILAMGCRERTRGSIMIPGTRPAGVMTAGTAQRYMNIEGYLPGHDVLILGSGDIGLIMARRLTLEGARVHAVLEIMPYSTGLTRNIVQCLDDFGIPLLLSHTVTSIHGEKRVNGATIARVDAHRNPIAGTEQEIPCDTLITSVGLVPENELTKMAGVALDPVTGGAQVDQRLQSSVPGIFACGNVLQVHDLVDNVTEEARRAGTSAAAYLAGSLPETAGCLSVKVGAGVRYAVPQRIDFAIGPSEPIKLFLRPTGVYRGAVLEVSTPGKREPLARFRRDRLTPGEMVILTLPQGSIAAGMETITVEVQSHE